MIIDKDLLRKVKEDFVTGHAGGTVSEITLIALLPVVCLFTLRALLINWAASSDHILVEFLILVMPLIAVQLNALSVTTMIAAAGLAGIILSCSSKTTREHTECSRREIISNVIRNYRGSLMIITCIALLAVDYQSFPRRFAKAETFGTALMDAGVGSIVAAGALSRGFFTLLDDDSKGSRTTSWRKGMLQTGLLLSLGIGRSLLTGLVGYQNHVGEYGAHWNFFLTLGALRLLSLLFTLRYFSPAQLAVLGISVMSFYQVALSQHGLLEYIHSDQRPSNIVLANKEGIFSLAGYWALHLLACALGSFLKEKGLGVWALGTAFLWALFGWCQVIIGQEVSRRACNMPYVLWMLALNVLCLGCFIALETMFLSARKGSPFLLKWISNNMLAVFLMANVATGLVNIMSNTLESGAWPARGIVTVYMAVVLLVPSFYVRFI